jgi:SAM-dependent methyltransferase
MEDNTGNAPSQTLRSIWESAASKPHVMLFLASFAALFFELLFIRWIPCAVHVIGFFTNLVLLASFMGMSIGVARGEKADGAVNRIFLRLLLLVGLVCLFVVLRVKAILPQDDHNLNEVSTIREPHLKVGIFFILTIAYGALLYAFVPFGELVGRYLKKFSPIKAYSINIFGSLCGVLLFSLLSYLGTPPALWLVAGCLSLLLFSPRLILHSLLTVLIIIMVSGAYYYEEKINSWQNFWSPYYNLKVFGLPPLPDGRPGGFVAHVNNFFLLSGVNTAGQDIELYELPFKYARPKTVLVLGSGGGNDISVALAHGAEKVDAVEIDPVVLKLGRFLNPQHPYSDPRVHVYLGDARNFLKSAREKYDLVIFGTLDSHGLFSALSSIKMENFVYTRESFQDVKRILAPNGIVCLTVGFNRLWIPFRLYGGLKEVFGNTTVVHYGSSTLVSIVTGPGMEGREPVKMAKYIGIPDSTVINSIVALPESRLIPTDDWPHLFLKRRTLPLDYLQIMAAMLLISCIPLVGTFRRSGNFSPHFFFLGAGFLLLETKSITELALTFGSTWITNSVVISSIMLVVLLANLVVLRLKPGNYIIPYILLFLCLALTYLLPHKSLIVSSGTLQVLVSSLFCGLPIVFSSIIFAMSFSRAANVTGAFSSNLLGCVIGGLCEYLSLPFGFRFLVLVAMAMYFFSIYGLPKGREEAAEGSMEVTAEGSMEVTAEGSVDATV